MYTNLIIMINPHMKLFIIINLIMNLKLAINQIYLLLIISFIIIHFLKHELEELLLFHGDFSLEF